MAGGGGFPGNQKTPGYATVAHSPSVCQHGEESVLVNVVVTFAQTFRAILVGGTKTIVGIVAPSAALCVCEVHIHRTFN